MVINLVSEEELEEGQVTEGTRRELEINTQTQRKAGWDREDLPGVIRGSQILLTHVEILID